MKKHPKNDKNPSKIKQQMKGHKHHACGQYAVKLWRNLDTLQKQATTLSKTMGNVKKPW